MSWNSRTVLRFALAGVIVAAVVGGFFLVYLKSNPPNDWITSAVALVAVILCPGFLPFGWAAGIELEIPSLSVILLTVAGMNFVLYGAIGAAYVKLRNWREGTNTVQQRGRQA